MTGFHFRVTGCYFIKQNLEPTGHQLIQAFILESKIFFDAMALNLE
jgi:hypothetical protein